VVEVLMLVAVLAILASILLPTFGRVSDCGGRSVDASNLRQIGQASFIYANDHREDLPGLNLNSVGEITPGRSTPGIHAIAAALARHGGLNDATLWVSRSDRTPHLTVSSLTVVLDRASMTVSPAFADSPVSYQYVAGLSTNAAPTTPLAFTRGLQSDGNWTDDAAISVYGRDGGYMTFMGGNVAFYRDLRGRGGELKNPRGGLTSNLLEAVPGDARIFSYPATTTGAISGLAGTTQ